jgi:cell division protein FtsL
MRKMILWVFYGLLLTAFIGCSDSKEELRIEKLNQKIDKLYSQLEDKDKTIHQLSSKLSFVKDNNAELNISLLQATTDFAEEHKQSLESEFLKKYSGYVLIPFTILILFLLYFIYSNKREKQISTELEKSILDKDEKIEKSHKLNNNQEKKIIHLTNRVEILESKRKEGIKNQIVTKIEEHEKRRARQLERIRGEAW